MSYTSSAVAHRKSQLSATRAHLVRVRVRVGVRVRVKVRVRVRVRARVRVVGHARAPCEGWG